MCSWLQSPPHRHLHRHHRSDLPQAILGQVLSLVAILYLRGPPAALGLLLGILVTGKHAACRAIRAGRQKSSGHCSPPPLPPPAYATWQTQTPCWVRTTCSMRLFGVGGLYLSRTELAVRAPGGRAALRMPDAWPGGTGKKGWQALLPCAVPPFGVGVWSFRAAAGMNRHVCNSSVRNAAGSGTELASCRAVPCQVDRMARTDCAIAQLAVLDENSRSVLGHALSSREHALTAVHLRLVRARPAGAAALCCSASAGLLGLARCVCTAALWHYPVAFSCAASAPCGTAWKCHQTGPT